MACWSSSAPAVRRVPPWPARSAWCRAPSCSGSCSTTASQPAADHVRVNPRVMQLFKRNVSPHELILFAMEMMVICAAMVVAIRLHGAHGAWPWQILPAAALCQLCLYYNDVYDLSLVQSGRELLV